MDGVVPRGLDGAGRGLLVEDGGGAMREQGLSAWRGLGNFCLVGWIGCRLRRPGHGRGGRVQLQAVVAVLVHGLALGDAAEGIAHEHLVVARGEQGGGHVDEDGDPGVVMVGEDLAAVEDGGHEAGAEVTREVRRDGDVGEAPHHGGVREADDEGGGGGGDEGVGRVESGPDDDADVGVGEPFDQEEVAQVGLVGKREGNQDAGGRCIEGAAHAGGERAELFVVHAHEHETSHEGA
nr:hypothetical protein CFP56_19588 [Quercus suber]